MYLYKNCVAFILALVVLLGCAFPSLPRGSYEPPLMAEALDKTVLVSKGYDETWGRLMTSLGGSFFAIETAEKDSGQITLSFGSTEDGTDGDIGPSKYASGGYLVEESRDFMGDWADYMTLYYDGKLHGTMNISVKKIKQSETRVTVNADYIFTTKEIIKIRFDSDSCGSQDTQKHISAWWIFKKSSLRTLCPTHFAEKSILESL